MESLVGVQKIQSQGDELLIDYYADLLREDPGQRNDLLQDITTDKLTRDRVITPDGRRSVVALEYAAGDRSMETAPQAMDRVIHCFESYGFQARELYVGGLQAVAAEMVDQSLFSLERILPFTALILLGTVYLMFRRLWPVFLTGVITAMAIVWTLGAAVVLYGHINIFTTMIPALILITCFADVVHLVSAYLVEISRGLDGKRPSCPSAGKWARPAGTPRSPLFWVSCPWLWCPPRSSSSWACSWAWAWLWPCSWP